ncbi:prepilin-type N-terminal cleavage/methylation domain-containing protein [bacterium]|nr:MAG: prepilin-type N-terminal cleavage/methylation domain-containing protein [bacterium]
MNSPRSRRGGFSLLELLVVLGVAALMGSLALGGFSSFQGSQRRSTCQSNLVQIYRACRLYSNDFDNYPPLLTSTTEGRVGGLSLLWGTAQTASGNSIVRPPVDSSVSYLKSSSALHCPADVAYDTTSSPEPTKDDGAGGRIIDTKYLSYQKQDALDPVDPTQFTYNNIRTNNTQDPDFARQLWHISASGRIDIPTPSNTIITWCTFHRGLSSKPDNVLFYDGSVRRMERIQAAGCLPGRSAKSGWLRLSECSTTSNNEGAALAQP